MTMRARNRFGVFSNTNIFTVTRSHPWMNYGQESTGSCTATTRNVGIQRSVTKHPSPTSESSTKARHKPHKPVPTKRGNLKVRTFCEHPLCDGVHQGGTRCVCVLLESEPILDSPHGPNALVMRRSGVRISEAAPRFWLVFGKSAYILRTFV